MPTPATLKNLTAACNAGSFLDGPGPLKAILLQWRKAVRPRMNSLLIIAGPSSPLLSVPASFPHAMRWVIETPQNYGLASKPFSLARFESRVQERLLLEVTNAPGSAPWGVVIDMDWMLLSPASSANASVWGQTTQRMGQFAAAGVLCFYHRRHMPERVLIAGLHAHTTVVAEDGCHLNPYYLPDTLASAASARARLDHWLGFISPALITGRQTDAAPAQGSSSRMLSVDADASNAADPSLLGSTDERWKVRCFGGLRVYLASGERIGWQGSSAASRKVRCLFAFLLLRGSRGATAEELIEMLWPGADTEHLATNRLHHSINSLRRALLPNAGPGASSPSIKARLHPYVLRQDGRYALRPPSNTWLDVEDFEQLCRQGGTLLKDGALNEALLCLESALKLYSGDLFDDLPAAFTESRDPDWCWSQRYWFREMYFKVHRDCASVHRIQGNYLLAIQHCQKALERDSACEIAHSELMRIYAAQGRKEALERQFRLYKLALPTTGQTQSDTTVHSLYVQLMRQ
jgi:two-component SAPR family response regulator